MLSRWVLVILGMSRPFELETISRIDDALGVVVPIPALPVDGNIFCAAYNEQKIKEQCLIQSFV
jgi:hypothetical protein